MAEYTIAKIKLPNGDICNLKDTNTTYGFASGIDSFTVTPLGGAAQTVEIKTDSIEFVNSTNTTASNTLTGKINGSLFSGKMLIYRIAYTLEEKASTLTLANSAGTSLGNYPLYMDDSNPCTAPYPAGTMLFLVFYNNKYLITNPFAVVE